MKRIYNWNPISTAGVHHGWDVHGIIHIAPPAPLHGHAIRIRLAEGPKGWVGSTGEGLTIPVTHVAPNQATDRVPAVAQTGRVLLVGVGSGGAPIAAHLAHSGAVHHIDLVDCDVLEVENLSRHPLDIEHLGHPKAESMATFLRSQLCGAEVVGHHFDILTDVARIAQLVERADVVICGTDNIPSRRLLSRLAASAQRVALFARAYHLARGGDVFTQAALTGGEAPCLDCWLTKLPAEERKPEAPAYALHPIAAPVLGLGLDIAPISHMAARLALQHLTGTALTAGLWLWRNEPQGAWRPADNSPHGLTTLQWTRCHIPVDTQCPGCGETAFLAQIG
jgi:molybdopterin/thiamine biosynthesis adenylyltransferase